MQLKMNRFPKTTVADLNFKRSTNQIDGEPMREQESFDGSGKR